MLAWCRVAMGEAGAVGWSRVQGLGLRVHPAGDPGANLKSISHRCHPILVAFVWELTKETMNLLFGELS